MIEERGGSGGPAEDVVGGSGGPAEDVGGGLVRPAVAESDAERIALECYGITAVARELGSNQDRNFVLEEASGALSVLRIDNPVFEDSARDAQHAAIAAYQAAAVPVAAVVAGLNGELTQRWNGFAVRRSEYAYGEALVDAGYLAPVVLQEFGALAASSVQALATLTHPGLDREHMWDMRRAHAETLRLASAITDAELRERVLSAAEEAHAALEQVSSSLPVQAIHGDLTDDNVVGVRGDDTRLHPNTVLDLGDLSYGWRVAEPAVTVASLLHHEPGRPLRVLEAVAAFHSAVPLLNAEARALWPLVVLRAGLLVASGWRQLEIDGDNEYAKDRIGGEQAIFDSATAYPLAEMTEQVLARLGMIELAAVSAELRHPAAPEEIAGSTTTPTTALRSILPTLEGRVQILDPGIESDDLDAGVWLSPKAESRMVARALANDANTAAAPAAERVDAAVFPYGVYRLTRTATDSAEPAPTWPVDTEVWVRDGGEVPVAASVAGRVQSAERGDVVIDVDGRWTLRFSGISPAVEAGGAVTPGTIIGKLPASELSRWLAVGIRRADAPALPGAQWRAALVTPERVAAWRRFTLDPAALLGIDSHAQVDESGDELLRREQIFASAQERYYERPMQIERGWRHHLVDTTGRSYVDMVNNVTGLGHGHPAIADAVNQQIRRLNTNSRFLYRELAEYSERLLELVPKDSELDTVLLVNSGSEAVDLALRLAQAATGRKTIVALREAYHGWTMASDAVTTSAYDNPYALESRPDWIHIADVPNRFRGTYRGAADDPTVGARYSTDLGNDLARLAAEGRDVAGFICESVLGNAGGVVLPAGYLGNVYSRVRAAGGLCIADEVQVGFGRMGSSFWGFEQSGVVPDIITIAKPMGNGFPIGGVITSKRVADALATQGQFFASAGGSPVSCRVGIAVLDAMRDEGLQENARIIGERLAAGFRALAEKHAIVGPVHGEGLYLGVELVRDRETLEPAKEETVAICERLKELGVIMLTTSERSNVLKVKPPLCLTEESADFVVAQLDRVLTEGW